MIVWTHIPHVFVDVCVRMNVVLLHIIIDFVRLVEVLLRVMQLYICI